MRNFKLRNLMMALALVMFTGFWSCNSEDVDDQGPFVTGDSTSFTFDANGGEKTMAIHSNRDWKATLVGSEVEKWVTITPDKGSGDGSVKLTVLPNDGGERSAILKLTASTVSVDIKITQLAKGGGPVVGDAIYQENCGTTVEKVNDKWPYVDQFAGWQKGGTLDQTGVTYSGSGANVSNSGPAFEPGDGSAFSGAPYVGLNYSSSSPVREFRINGINITGKTNFTFKFGSVFQSAFPVAFGPVTAASFTLSASVDGVVWAPLTYTVAPEGTNWYRAVSEFKVPDGSTKLYIKYVATPLANQGYRIDDFKLFEGGNGNLIEGGEQPGEKVYTTLTKIREMYKGSNVTISEEVWVKASVVSDVAGGNSVSKKNVIISDGVAGITLRFSGDADYAFGDQIQLPVKGISLERYQEGALQLNGVVNTTVEKVGTELIPVKSISSAQLVSGAFESMYVSVADVEVANEDIGKPFGTTDAHGSLNFISKTGETFIVFTSKYAKFVTETVPSGSGVLKGVASNNAGNIQVMPNIAADYAGLTGTRFGEAAILSFGTPSFSATTIKVGEAIAGGKISIPYNNAAGTETYNISVAVSGDAAAGIDEVSDVSETLTAGSGTIELDITGTPTTAGSVTFTISGIDGLATTTVTGTVAAAGSSDAVYETGFEDSGEPAGKTANDYQKDKEFTLSGIKWKLQGSDIITTGSPAVGSWQWCGRVYKGKTDIPSLWSDENLTTSTGEVTTVNFKALGAATVSLKVYYSIDNGITWNPASLTQEDGTAWDGLLATSYKDYVAVINATGAVRLKFTYTVDAADTKSNRDEKLDEIVVNGKK